MTKSLGASVRKVGYRNKFATTSNDNIIYYKLKGLVKKIQLIRK